MIKKEIDNTLLDVANNDIRLIGTDLENIHKELTKFNNGEVTDVRTALCNAYDNYDNILSRVRKSSYLYAIYQFEQ